MIMGHVDLETFMADMSDTSQERVGHNDKRAHKIYTVNTDERGSTCTDFSTGSMSVHGITCTDVSSGSKVLCQSMCIDYEYHTHQPKLPHVESGK